MEGGTTRRLVGRCKGFFQLFMGIMCFVYLIASVRTNVCFLFIFFTLVMAFGMLTAAYWHLAEGNAALATKFITVSNNQTDRPN